MNSEIRIRFGNKQSRKSFFRELKSKAECKTYPELAIKLKIPVGRLRLYVNGARGIPKEDIDNWVREFSVRLDTQNYNAINMKKLYLDSARKAVEVLKQRYGKNWAKITGSRSMKKLRKAIKNNPETRRKWRKAIEASLRNKFGPDFYSEMGKIGGRKSIAIADKKELKKRYKQMFRKSFRYRIKFDGKDFRSNKEIEVAKILVANRIRFEYEKQLFGFYPDFLLDNKIIIEAVGLEWKPHIERTVEKIKLFTNKGFSVILYTYPNMVKYFEKLSVKIATNEKELLNALGYNRGEFGSFRSESDLFLGKKKLRVPKRTYYEKGRLFIGRRVQTQKPDLLDSEQRGIQSRKRELAIRSLA